MDTSPNKTKMEIEPWKDAEIHGYKTTMNKIRYRRRGKFSRICFENMFLYTLDIKY